MNLTINTYSDDTVFDDLKADWHALHSAASRQPIFTTWEWQSNWWAAYQPGELWIITLQNEDGELVGIAPWFIDDHPKGRLVRMVGCVDVTDYLELIIREGYETAVLEHLATVAAEHRERYTALDFCNIPHDTPILPIWQDKLEANGFSVRITQQEVCPIISLPDDFGDYLANLDKKQRHEVRRKLRRAEGSEKPITWGFTDPDADLCAEIERFMALMRASNPQKAAFLEDPKHVDFFQRALPAIAERGWLKMAFLQIDGQDAAAYLSFDYHNRIMLYNSGHNPANHPELSLGIVLLTYLIRDAIETGHEAFDFLRGDEEYKYRMGGQDFPVVMLNAKPE